MNIWSIKLGKGRVEKSAKNVSVGLIVTVVNTLTAFIGRKAFVVFLGNNALGLNGLYSEVIDMLSLAELGIGMAIVYNLYRPLLDKDNKKISQLMGLYKTAYSVVAIVILIGGIILYPFIDSLVNDIDYPVSYIRFIFLLFVIKTASSYLFSYKTSLLNADQKQYIVSLTTAIGKAIFTVISIVFMYFTRNYTVYLILMIVQTIAINVSLSIYVDKNYPFLDYSQKLDQEEREKVFNDIKNIFLKRVSGVITSSTDNILISKLISTIQVGLYSNYVLIYSGVRSLRIAVTGGIAASVGELSVSEKPEKCIQVLRRLTYIYYAIGIIITAGLFSVCDVFVEMLFGKQYVLSTTVVVISIFNLYLETCCDPLWQFLETSGLFDRDKYIGLIGSFVNLVVSIVLGMKIGMAGIFIGTVCTQVIQLVLKSLLIYREKYHRSPLDYYLLWAKMICLFFVLLAVKLFFFDKIVFGNLLLSFFIKGCIGVLFGLAFAIIPFCRSEEYSYAKQIVMKYVKRNTDDAK